MSIAPMTPPVGYPRSVAELIEARDSGSDLGFRFFWGHRPPANGVGPACLSQWFAASFVVDGARYASAEQFMMERKARLFDDDETAEMILAADGPERAKALGRRVRGFNDARWQAHRVGIVVAGNRAKFGQNDPLRGYLLSTGDDILVEASPLDAVWGIGLAASDERAPCPELWPGLNLLGFALMDVRAALRAA